MQIERNFKYYKREDVEKDTRSMYIFTDNTDRDSGKSLISPDTWYCKRFGNGKHYPMITSAVIRGLDNAYPITTQRWYNSEHKGNTGRWNDWDFREFKEVIDADFELIKENMGKYDRIVFPVGGIFNSKISNITQERVPALYEYLMGKCKELLEL